MLLTNQPRTTRAVGSRCIVSVSNPRLNVSMFQAHKIRKGKDPKAPRHSITWSPLTRRRGKDNFWLGGEGESLQQDVKTGPDLNTVKSILADIPGSKILLTEYLKRFTFGSKVEAVNWLESGRVAIGVLKQAVGNGAHIIAGIDRIRPGPGPGSVSTNSFTSDGILMYDIDASGSGVGLQNYDAIQILEDHWIPHNITMNGSTRAQPLITILVDGVPIESETFIYEWSLLDFLAYSPSNFADGGAAMRFDFRNPNYFFDHYRSVARLRRLRRLQIFGMDYFRSVDRTWFQKANRIATSAASGAVTSTAPERLTDFSGLLVFSNDEKVRENKSVSRENKVLANNDLKATGTISTIGITLQMGSKEHGKGYAEKRRDKFQSVLEKDLECRKVEFVGEQIKLDFVRQRDVVQFVNLLSRGDLDLVLPSMAQRCRLIRMGKIELPTDLHDKEVRQIALKLRSFESIQDGVRSNGGNPSRTVIEHRSKTSEAEGNL